MDKKIPEQEKSHEPSINDEQKALDDIFNIRDEQRKNEVNRVTEFELAFEGKLVSGHDVWSLKEAEQQQLGDNQSLQESNPEVRDTELTDEQLQYIMEVEANAGIEFNDYDEAVEWERNEYGDNDISQDDPFDLER